MKQRGAPAGFQHTPAFSACTRSQNTTKNSSTGRKNSTYGAGGGGGWVVAAAAPPPLPFNSGVRGFSEGPRRPEHK
jgi:hypothetical protein